MVANADVANIMIKMGNWYQVNIGSNCSIYNVTREYIENSTQAIVEEATLSHCF